MINNDRIVPITKMDLLSMFGTMLGLIGTAYTPLKASTVEGAFSVPGTGDAGTLLADQPVQSMDFPAEVTAGAVYFVAAYDYTGMTIAGAETAPTGTVIPDGVTLYKAELASGAITITPITPVVA